MAVQINSGNANFRIGTEGPGNCGPFEWEGRWFILGMDISAEDAEVWYTEDDGATWAEADSASAPGGVQNDFSVGVIGCAVGPNLYVVWADGVQKIRVSVFSMQTLTWGRTLATSDTFTVVGTVYDAHSGVVPLPGERLRILFTADSGGGGFGVFFIDVDLITETWTTPVRVETTATNSKFPQGLYKGVSGTHAFWKNETNDRGYHVLIEWDGTVGTEQEIIGESGLPVDFFGFGAGDAQFNPATGEIELAIPYLGEEIASPFSHCPIKVLRADSAATITDSEVTVSTDPVYHKPSSADGCVVACCFFGDNHDLYVAHCGMAVADLPKGEGDLNLFRRKYDGSWSASTLVADPGGTTDVTSVRMRALSTGIGIVYVTEYASVWFELLELDPCGGGAAVVNLVGAAY